MVENISEFLIYGNRDQRWNDYFGLVMDVIVQFCTDQEGIEIQGYVCLNIFRATRERDKFGSYKKTTSHPRNFGN